MIEAMACGTPVIAWRCGSVPEVVEPGITGAIVSSEDEAIGALKNLELFDRRRVREEFERRFSTTAMAQRYVALYRRLIERQIPIKCTA